MSRLIQLKNKLGELFFVRPYFPINYVMITADNVNPSSWAGGTWEVFATGKTLIGVDSAQNEFDSVLKTGGSKYMQNHYHFIISGEPSSSGNTNFLPYSAKGVSATGNNSTKGYGASTSIYGKGNAENLPPYITVYFWKKTAM